MSEPLDIAARLAQAPEADAAWIAAHDPDAAQEPAPELPPDEPDAGDDQPPEPPPEPPPAAGDGDGDPDLRNELADADRLVLDLIGKAWYCPQRRKRDEIESGWLVWDGRRLRPSEDGAILRQARQTALALSAEYQSQAKLAASEVRNEENCEPVDKAALNRAKRSLSRLLALADKAQSEQRILVMIRLARIDQRLLIDATELDADPDTMNTPSGVLHLRTGEVWPHDPKYRCTRITRAPVRPEAADDPILHQVLRRCTMQQREDGVWVPDPERVTYLQDSIGHALYGHQRLQKFYLCIGEGGDGKGTLFESLLAALGGGKDGYAMMAAASTFVRQKNSGHRIRDDLANMHQARVVLAAELNKGDALDASLMKSMFGQTTQRVRELYGKEFEFKPICTLFLQANHEPHLDAQDHAIWRRTVKIPFGPKLREDEKDPDVYDYLNDPERGGAAVLAWALIGARRTAQAKGIAMPASVIAATSGYRDDQNYLAGFLVDELRFAPAAQAKLTYVAQAAIRPAIETWFAETRMEDKRNVSINGKTLGKLLRDAGAFPGLIRILGKTTRVWFGVTLRQGHPLYDDHCDGSYLPADDLHHKQLAQAKGATTVIDVTCNVITGSPRAHEKSEEEKCHARGISGDPFPAHTAVSSSEVTGYKIKEEISKKKGEDNRSDNIPDLDDLTF